jgi:hypothetical protein
VPFPFSLFPCPFRPAAVLLFFAAATVFATYPQAFHPRRLIGYHHDAEFSAWRLAWVAHQLPRDPTRLFDANIFHPEPRTLAYSDAVLLPAVLAAPLHWAGMHPLAVYHVVLLAGFFCSALAMYALVRALTASTPAAMLAGLSFAFASHRFEHYERLELQVCVWIPLALLALVRLFESGLVRYGVSLGALIAAQVYSGIYHAVFFVTYLPAVAIPLLIASGRMRQRFALGLFVAVALATLLSAPYLGVYLQNRAAVGERSAVEVLPYSAVASDYFGSHSNAGGLPALRQFGAAERYLYPGFLLIAFAAIALAPPFNAWRLAFLCGLLLAFEAARGFHSGLYQWLFENVTVYRGLRAPARFAILVQLSLGVLAGFGVARVLGAIERRRLRLLVAVGIVAAGVVEYRGQPRLRSVPEASRIYSWLAREPPSRVLELPIERDFVHSVDPEYMLASALHWQRLLNGYSGFFPASYIELIDRLESFPDETSLDYLQSRGVDLILIHRRFLDDDRYKRITLGLAASRRVQLAARYIEDGHPVDAYRLQQE